MCFPLSVILLHPRDCRALCVLGFLRRCRDEWDHLMTATLEPLNLKLSSSPSFSLFNHLTSYLVIWEFQVLELCVTLLFKIMVLFSTCGFHTNSSKHPGFRSLWLESFSLSAPPPSPFPHISLPAVLRHANPKSAFTLRVSPNRLTWVCHVARSG